jgi:hypothetical protein
MMDKRLLDPRRPRLAPGAKPAPQMQAEGLVPYAEELPFSTLMFATLDKQVGRSGGRFLGGGVSVGGENALL